MTTGLCIAAKSSGPHDISISQLGRARRAGTDKVIPKVNPHNLNLLCPFFPKTVPCPSLCRSSNSGKYSGDMQSGSSGSNNEVNLNNLIRG